MTYENLRTPSYIVLEKKLKENLELLRIVEDRSGAKILLAQKAFSMFEVYPLIGEYLSGTTASGIYEARLSFEEMIEKSERPLENHVFEPAYKEDEMGEICEICDHVYFNSIAQLERHRKTWQPYVEAGRVEIALRINPEYSTQEGHEIYDPCSPSSRLGIKLCDMPSKLPEGVTGLHMHTLCEQGFEPLLAINLGGGHHITREGYDVDGLVALILEIREKYGIDVYLEPGEAIALDAGILITEVMDIVNTPDMPTLILDASAACHMPDVLEMPYTPPLLDAASEGEPSVKVRLASRTCLAGDVIGVYDMPSVPKIGDILTFGDMAIYSMVKNNTFNGMPLPDIVLECENGEHRIVKQFDYQDFKERLS